MMKRLISLKLTISFLVTGIVTALGISFLLIYIFGDSYLGRVYDLFLKYRKTQDASAEILIIKSDDYVESQDVFNVLMALSEFGASGLILEARLADFAQVIGGTEDEIREHFNDEFDLTMRNIRVLFEGIKLGFVKPEDASSYVDNLVELTEQGKTRLLSSLITRDEKLMQSISAFGNFEETKIKPVIDNGVIRRVNPFIETEKDLYEHPVYRILKTRYYQTQIEISDHERCLILSGFDGNEKIISLDKKGNILTSKPDLKFRTIDIDLFRKYEDSLRSMRRLLKEADDIGAFAQTRPDLSPLILGAYADSLRETFLQEGGGQWIMARNKYLKSLGDFLYGPAEMLLVSGYEEVIADEKTLRDEGINKLKMLRDEMIRSFIGMREKYIELSGVYSVLQDELSSAFCIMGPAAGYTGYSALLANTLITGSHNRVADNRYVLLASIIYAAVILLIIFTMHPFLQLTLGLGLSALSTALCGLVLIFWAYWINPLVIFGGAVSGTLVVFFLRLAAFQNAVRRLRFAYSASIPKNILREIIRSGGAVSQIIIANSAVVAIKNNELKNCEYQNKAAEFIKQKKTYYEAARKNIFNSGGIIAGFENDIILACFGSPFNRSKNPVNEAYTFVKRMMEDVPWHFGIDAGECAFSWSPETGFYASGKPAINAKVLVSSHLKKRVLITETIRENIDIEAEKAGTLQNKNDFFYEILG
jgi:hypothetical protein